MSLGEFIPSSSTKLLLHLNGSSADSSGLGNNGTDTAITYSQANGKFGQGAGFNGSSSFILLPTNVITSFPFSISFWTDYIASSGTNAYLFSNRYGNVDGRLLIVDLSNSSGSPVMELVIRNSSYATASVNTSPALSLNTGMNHYAFSFATGTNNIHYYLNGSLVYTGTLGSTDAFNSTIPFVIGKYLDYGNSNAFLSGKLDEFIVENIAWSAEKVKKYYTYSKGRFGVL